MSRGGSRHRPAYYRMLWAILVAYTLIIGFSDNQIGDPARILLLAYLVWTSARLHTNRHWRIWAVIAGVAATVATGCAALFASPRVVYGVVGASSVLLIGLSIAAIVSTLLVRLRVDASTVLGVLCIYLMFALFFASVHQIFAATIQPYLNGVGPIRPTSSDLLYFSVITLTTVGYGDITPLSEVARAVSVVEALTGQLYLVSVVAGVVSGWRGSGEHHRDNPVE